MTEIEEKHDVLSGKNIVQICEILREINEFYTHRIYFPSMLLTATSNFT